MPAKGGNKTNNTLVLFVHLPIHFLFPCAAKRGQGAPGHELPLYGLGMSDLALRRPGIQKKTCGSTVFSTGHPRQYSLAPAMLVCADRTRRGRFIAVWPQMRRHDSESFRHLPKSCRQSNFRYALLRLLALPGLAQYLQDLSRPVFFLEGDAGSRQSLGNAAVVVDWCSRRGGAGSAPGGGRTSCCSRLDPPKVSSRGALRCSRRSSRHSVYT